MRQIVDPLEQAKPGEDEVTFERHVGRTDVRVNGGLVATRNDNQNTIAWHGSQTEPVRQWIREKLAQIPRTLGRAATELEGGRWPVNRAQRRAAKHRMKKTPAARVKK